MTISINQLNNGMGLKLNDELYIVTEYHHVKPGKGSAFVRVKLRNVKTDAVLERTFRTADKLEDVVLEEREIEFLYRAADLFYFLDHTTYEQVHLSQEKIGDAAEFLLENLTLTGLYHDHAILKVILPNFITAEIKETEPGIKGDSSRAGTKPAGIEPGAVILVPLFINTGDWIKIDTRSGQYVERVQK